MTMDIRDVIVLLVGVFAVCKIIFEIVFLARRRHCNVPVKARVSSQRWAGKSKAIELNTVRIFYDYAGVRYEKGLRHRHDSGDFYLGKNVDIKVDDSSPDMFLAHDDKIKAVYNICLSANLLLIPIIYFIVTRFVL